MKYLTGNALISALLLGAVASVATACGPSASDVADTVERKLATTTTTHYEPPTTTTEAWSDSTFAEDDVFSALTDAVPALDGLPISAVREQLLTPVCERLDSTEGDFAAVGEEIVDASQSNFDFDFGDAGSIMAAAVALECSQWLDAAQEYANS